MKYLPKVAQDKENTEARRQLLYILCLIDVEGCSRVVFSVDWPRLSLVSGSVMLASTCAMA